MEATAVLPPLYARWMNALLGKPVAAERRATCDDCAMCAPDGGGEADTVYFSPQTKCCTYQPRLANFLVGRALEEQDVAFSGGRATLQRRIENGVGVTPLALEMTRKYEVLYQQGSAGFGRAGSMRCPHYLTEEGRCGIWRHRNSVCATWFCKHERGAVGRAFWDHLRDLLMGVERELAAWCVLESDLDADAIGLLFAVHRQPDQRKMMSAADLDDRTDPKRARDLWQHWLGREEDFYRECWRRVESLTWKEVLGICGPVVEGRARVARRAFDALLREELPRRLAVGPFQIVSTRHEAVRVVGYSDNDPLDLAPGVLEVLSYFDGRATTDALRVLRHQRGIRVQENLVRKLADFEILVSRDS